MICQYPCNRHPGVENENANMKMLYSFHPDRLKVTIFFAFICLLFLKLLLLLVCCFLNIKIVVSFIGSHCKDAFHLNEFCTKLIQENELNDTIKKKKLEQSFSSA